MTVEISRRGKAFLETARTLLRAAQTMTDAAIAGQPLPTTTSGELRRLRMLMQPKHSLDRQLSAEKVARLSRHPLVRVWRITPPA